MNSIEKTGQLYEKEWNWTTFSYKNKLKWIKYLNVKPETIKFLEENTDSMLFDSGLKFFFFFFFFDMSPQGRGNKRKKKQMGYIKLKSFCTTKESNHKAKRPPTEWENISTNNTYDKGVNIQNIQRSHIIQLKKKRKTKKLNLKMDGEFPSWRSG